MNNKIKLEITEKQARVIKVALDAYGRAKLYQFDLWLDATFPELDFRDYEARQELNKFFEKFITHRSRTKSSEELAAYDVYKTLEQYFAVKNNDGYFGFGVSFNGPLYETEEDCPKIEGFNPYKDIKIPKKLLGLLEDEKYELFWKDVDKEVLPKHDITGWGKIEILKDEKILRIWKPRKD